EAQRLPQEGSAEVVRRRDDLARHRPGLQRVHDAAARAGGLDRRRKGFALPAASRARGRELRHPRVAPAAVRGAAVARVEARAHRLHPQRLLRGDAGRNVGALVHGRAVQVGRQDRHRAGHRDQGQREVQRFQARRAASRPRALHRVRTARGAARRARDRGRERGLWRRGGGADRAPHLRLPARRQVSERGRHRSDAARPDDCAGRRPAPDRFGAAAGRDRRRRSDCACRRPGGEPAAHGTAADGGSGSRVGAGARAEATRGRARRAAAMSAVFDRPSLWQRARPVFTGFDVPLLFVVLLLAAAGLVTMYSAGHDQGTRFPDHARNMMLAFGVLFLAAQIPPQQLQKLAIPLYVVGLVLIIATALPGIGITRKGATRWLSIGVTTIQPSEIMKIAMPLMIAWWFQRREGQLRILDFAIAAVLLLVPVAIIVKQPDLGTAILVLSAGLYVIFFVGLSWKLIIPVALIGAAAITAIVVSEEQICQPEVKWPMLRDYQKNRVCTLLDPTTDPLGKGFHTIQGEIAIGSGGTTGKGFMKGTQTHLEFIPERTTDFVFAAFAEEFGLAGCSTLLLF